MTTINSTLIVSLGSVAAIGNAIEENWARPIQLLQKRWVESFVKAAEAVAARDSGEFATHMRELKRAGIAGETNRNFFTAK